MAVIGEVVELLRRWDVWKRVEEAPNRLDALEKRVAALEAGAPSGAVGEPCPFCGTGKMLVKNITANSIFGDMGVQDRELVCQDCGKTQVVMHDPSNVTGAQPRRR